MNLYEKLLIISEEHNIIIDRSKVLPGIDGAFIQIEGVQPVIYLAPDLSGHSLNAIFAEELGHFFLSYGNSCVNKTLKNDMDSLRCESRAFRYAVDLVMNPFTVWRLLKVQKFNLYDLSQYYEVPVSFIADALKVFKIRYVYPLVETRKEMLNG